MKGHLQLLLTPAASQPPPGTGKLQFPKLSEAAARAVSGKPKYSSHTQLFIRFLQGPPVFQECSCDNAVVTMGRKRVYAYVGRKTKAVLKGSLHVGISPLLHHVKSIS